MLPRPGSWFEAWLTAAYGPAGFWLRSGPTTHFRTASTTGPELAQAVVALLDRFPGVTGVLDVGAGDGQLLGHLHQLLRPGRRRVELVGVDLRPRPSGLPAEVGWLVDRWDVPTRRWSEQQVPALLAGRTGPTLLVAAEWLDDLPCPVALDGLELGADGTPAAPLEEVERAWVAAWWPDGGRVEVGWPRDEAWAGLVRGLAPAGGLALMVDYGHLREHRPTGGSLAGYRSGRPAPSQPDPASDLTAAVAVDAVQTAGERAGATTLRRCRQRTALADLLPPPGRGDEPRPQAALAELAARSRHAALTAPGGLGDHWWLLQQVVAR